MMPSLPRKRRSHGSTWGLALGAVGVVYGDIGTSPIYAFRELLHHSAGSGLTRDEVIGTCSLLFWALIITVTLKYVVFIMRADNKGEGGTLTLLTLAQKALGRPTSLVFFLGIAGAALFYGDAIITPAVSVLGAVEGLKYVAPVMGDNAVLIGVVILVSLFLVQKFGTGKVGAFFGPIMLVWFLVLGIMGLIHLADDPQIFLALLPYYAVNFFIENAALSFFVLGSVVLVVTGGEALYADMGHFGKFPIRLAWGVLVLPALVLNYLGQGALVLAHPETAKDPFFLMAPEWGRTALVILTTVAAVIASQAVITGAYSLTRQAIQLGLLPRLRIRHTSERMEGQIYVPEVNAMLLVGVLVLVVGFQTSSALASAYGIAVTGAMTVDTLLAFIVARYMWNWPLGWVLAIVVPLLVIDMAFLGSNLLKFFQGGYLPVLLGTALILAMWTWQRGTRSVSQKARNQSIPIKEMLKMLKKSAPTRVEGTAIFLTSDPDSTPSALMHNLKHNRVMHKHNYLLTIRTSPLPRVPRHEQIEIKDIGEGVSSITLHVGYMQDPDVPKMLQQARRRRADIDPQRASYFMGRTRFIADGRAKSDLPFWQQKVFIWLYSVASDATEYFKIPSSRAVELGNQVVL